MNKFNWTIKNQKLACEYEDYKIVASYHETLFTDSLKIDNLYIRQPETPYWKLHVFWKEGSLSRTFYYLQELIEWTEKNILSKEERTVKEIVE